MAVFAPTRNGSVAEPMYNVLFLCTGNSARSILAEALLNHLGSDRFIAYSAGSTPTGRVNDLAIATLRQQGIPIGPVRSKSWDEFAFPDDRSAVMDIIITVCDNAAGETCPVWPGHPTTAHWGVADPAAAEGSDADKMAAFRSAFETLQARIRGLVALSPEEFRSASIKKRLNELGEL